MLKMFIHYYKPYKKMFFLDLVVATVAAVCDLFYPMITRQIINKVLPQKEYSVFLSFAIILIGIYFVKLFCNFFMQYWGHLVGVGMQANMRRDVYEHLQKLPIRYFDSNQTGSIMSKIINDLQEVSELAHHGPEDLFISFVMLFGSFTILVRINLWLTLIIFVFFPLILLFSMMMRKKLSAAFLKTREKTGIINARLQNSISGIRVSKAFVIADSERERFEADNKNYIDAREESYKVMAQYGAGVGFLIDLLDYVVLMSGGYFTYLGKISLGDLFAYLLYTKTFTQPLRRLIAFVEQYQNGMTGFQRFFELINEDVEQDKKSAVPAPIFEGEIEFQNVSFKHEDKEVLSHISFKIEKGKMLALVGPSGGGKTTLCNLIPRFYQIEEGDILIDGVSIYNMTLDSLRKNIGIVQQDVFLFTGTIRDNILVGKIDATDAEIEEASKKAKIDEFIRDLPEGLDTFVGERGVKLSGGQKQRIAVARIFLKNPPILILDEATSALDNITEQLIQKSLEELCKGRTSIVVAHRLTTIKNADEILVLTENGIEERGTHKALFDTKGYYYRLHGEVLQQH
jgi:ATP-binding cassette subfamily B protein